MIVFPAGGRSGPQEHVRMLARHGYGVLIFDPRGTGESEGDPYRWGGERDVKAALAYLRAAAGRRSRSGSAASASRSAAS